MIIHVIEGKTMKYTISSEADPAIAEQQSQVQQNDQSQKTQAQNNDQVQQNQPVNQQQQNINPDQKYVFIRLYKAEYKSGAFGAALSVLKTGIDAVNSSELKVHHAAMSLSLNDNFVGMTSGVPAVKLESVTHPETNRYISSLDPKVSVCYVYAIPVSVSEYKRIGSMLNQSMSNQKLRYDTIALPVMGIKLINRNIDAKEGNEAFNISLEAVNGQSDFQKVDAVGKNLMQKDPFKYHKFVCSTFVAYILSCVAKRFTKHFDKQDGYKFVSPADLVNVPGCKKLFDTTFEKYNQVAKMYVNKHPEFQPYFGK